MNWISVKDKPLFNMVTETEWEKTKAADNRLLVAIETNKGWWIKICYIDDDGDLLLFEEDDTLTDAGWTMDCVDLYIIIKDPKPQ